MDDPTTGIANLDSNRTQSGLKFATPLTIPSYSDTILPYPAPVSNL